MAGYTHVYFATKKVESVRHILQKQNCYVKTIEFFSILRFR